MNALPTEVWTGRDERGGGALLVVELVLDMVHRIELVRDLARTSPEIVAGAGIFLCRDDLDLHARQRSSVLRNEVVHQDSCDALLDCRLRQRAVGLASPSHPHRRLTDRFIAHVAPPLVVLATMLYTMIAPRLSSQRGTKKLKRALN